MTTEKLLNYGFLRPQDMSQTKNCIYLSLAQLRENFRQNCTELTMFVFVKSTKNVSKGVLLMINMLI